MITRTSKKSTIKVYKSRKKEELRKKLMKPNRGGGDPVSDEDRANMKKNIKDIIKKERIKKLKKKVTKKKY